MKLNKEQREQIAGALLGGQYRKACGNLKKHGRHCCLGAICEEVGIMEGDAAVIRDADGATVERMWGFLPDELAEAVGLSRPQQETLAEINDKKVGFYHQAMLILDGDVPEKQDDDDLSTERFIEGADGPIWL